MRKYIICLRHNKLNAIEIYLSHSLLDEVESLEAILMDDVLIERDSER